MHAPNMECAARHWQSRTVRLSLRRPGEWRNGRRIGLKIRWAERPVGVRIPPRPPMICAQAHVVKCPCKFVDFRLDSISCVC